MRKSRAAHRRLQPRESHDLLGALCPGPWPLLCVCVCVVFCVCRARATRLTSATWNGPDLLADGGLVRVRTLWFARWCGRLRGDRYWVFCGPAPMRQISAGEGWWTLGMFPGRMSRDGIVGEYYPGMGGSLLTTCWARLSSIITAYEVWTGYSVVGVAARSRRTDKSHCSKWLNGEGDGRQWEEPHRSHFDGFAWHP
jgi:hypothetical protein